MWTSKSVVAAATALVVSMSVLAQSALAHDPKMHAKQDQMNCEKMKQHMQMMQKMDHSKMDMDDPAMQAMMTNMSKMKQMYQQHCVSSDSDS